MLGRCSFDSLARKSATRSSSKRHFTYFGRPSSGKQSFYCSYHSRLERRSFERFHGEIERSNQDNRLDFPNLDEESVTVYPSICRIVNSSDYGRRLPSVRSYQF